MTSVTHKSCSRAESEGFRCRFFWDKVDMQTHPEAICQFFEHVERWVPRAAFETADVALVDACPLGEVFLREVLFPPQPDHRADNVHLWLDCFIFFSEIGILQALVE